MDYAIGFILGALAICFLWGLRELERRQVFEDAVEALDKERTQHRRCKEVCAYLHNGIHNVRIGLGGNGKLPAPVEHARQHHSLQQDYVRLTGPLNGGPDFSGRGQ